MYNKKYYSNPPIYTVSLVNIQYFWYSCLNTGWNHGTSKSCVFYLLLSCFQHTLLSGATIYLSLIWQPFLSSAWGSFMRQLLLRISGVRSSVLLIRYKVFHLSLSQEIYFQFRDIAHLLLASSQEISWDTCTKTIFRVK